MNHFGSNIREFYIRFRETLAIILCVSFLALSTVPCLAFESYIAKGYTSCLSCHHSARGASSLSAYGIQIRKNLVAFKSRTPPSNYSEQESTSETPTASSLQWGLSGRLANVKTNYGNDTFPMQADIHALFQKKNWSSRITLARAPDRSAYLSGKKPDEIEKYYFREAIVQFSLDSRKSQTIEVGRAPQNLGLAVEDHTWLSKAYNRFNVTDLTNMARYSIVKRKTEWHISAFAPNGQEIKNNRESGLKGEAFLNLKSQRIGLHYLTGNSPNVDRQVYGLTYKLKFFENMALISEWLDTLRLNEQRSRFRQSTSIVQLSLFPINFWEIFLGQQTLWRKSPFSLKLQNTFLGTRVRWNSWFSTRFDMQKLSGDQENTIYISQGVCKLWSW